MDNTCGKCMHYNPYYTKAEKSYIKSDVGKCYDFPNATYRGKVISNTRKPCDNFKHYKG